MSTSVLPPSTSSLKVVATTTCGPGGGVGGVGRSGVGWVVRLVMCMGLCLFVLGEGRRGGRRKHCGVASGRPRLLQSRTAPAPSQPGRAASSQPCPLHSYEAQPHRIVNPPTGLLSQFEARAQKMPPPATQPGPTPQYPSGPRQRTQRAS